MEEEELDEDDLEDEEEEKHSAGGSGALTRPSAAAPDYETLRRETLEMELRVHEFYKGVCVLPEEVQTEAVKEKPHTEVSKHNTRCLDLLPVRFISTCETSPLEGTTYNRMRSSCTSVLGCGEFRHISAAAMKAPSEDKDQIINNPNHTVQQEQNLISS